jgi:hypothetical protein
MEQDEIIQPPPTAENRPEPTPVEAVTRVLRLVLLLASAWYAVAFVWTSFGGRIAYPHELEWMEGGAVAHVQRALDGEPLYAAPSVRFVAFIYPPLYYEVSAVVARVWGPGYGPLRLVSALSTLLAALCIGLIVRSRAPGSFDCALIGAAFYLAAYRVLEGWYDLARVDALFLGLLLSAAWLLGKRESAAAHAAAALLMFLSFFTKQTALLIAAPLALWCVVFGRGALRVVFPAVFFAAVGLSTLIMNRLTDGWYGFYIFELPSRHAIQWELLTGFWRTDLFWFTAVAFIASVVALIDGFGGGRRDRAWFDLLFFAGMIGSAWFSRLHAGGYLNVLMPAYAALAIYYGIGLRVLLVRVRRDPAMLPAIYLAGLIQCVCLFYEPADLTPSAATRAEADIFVNRLSRVEGDVYVAAHAWYPAQAGKPTYAHAMAVEDVLRADGDDNEKERLKRGFEEAIAEEVFDAIVMDRPDQYPVGCIGFWEHYLLVDPELTDEALTPPSGWATRPRILFVSKGAQQRGDIP